MRNGRGLILALACIVFQATGCTTIHERIDYYGIRTEHEKDAKNFSASSVSEKDFQFSYDKERGNKSVYAYGYLETHGTRGDEVESVRILITNGSQERITTERLFTRFKVVTPKKELWVDASGGFYPQSKYLDPGRSQSYYLPLGRHRLMKEDILRIVCYLNLQETIIVMLPITE